MDFSNYQQIEFRRKFWKVFGASIDIIDPVTGVTLGYTKMKAFKLKEDISIYTDRTETQEYLRIKARNIIDFGTTYDVYEPTNDKPVISLRRKGLRSTFVRDYWNIADADGVQSGYIQETSSTLAILRRWLGLVPFVGPILELVFAFLPQTYSIYHGVAGSEALVGTIEHRKNPFIVKMGLTFTAGESAFDKRFGVAATSLLAIVDANKSS